MILFLFLTQTDIPRQKSALLKLMFFVTIVQRLTDIRKKRGIMLVKYVS